MPKFSLNNTLVILIGEGQLIESVGISEGDTKFLYFVKFVPPMLENKKDSGDTIHPNQLNARRCEPLDGRNGLHSRFTMIIAYSQ